MAVAILRRGSQDQACSSSLSDGMRVEGGGLGGVMVVGGNKQGNVKPASVQAQTAVLQQ